MQLFLLFDDPQNAFGTISGGFVYVIWMDNI